ncbi:MAG: lipopolysaccharide heptosyltransferase family protein [Gemmatimonadetes bacterium]|nr:MAG: lipopolysaccharide heptosyltransferase family protein [Gemmatimonadota bacterium]
MSQRPFGPDRPPRSVCIVMMSALGDAVHVLPVVTALRRAWPTTRITWVIQPVPHRLVEDHPAVDDFVVFRRRRGRRAWRAFADVRRELRARGPFDLLLALQVYAKAGLITALAPARVKLGFDRRRARDLNWLFTNARIPAHEPQHVQDQYFEFVRWLGIDPEPVEWGLTLSDAERREQAAFYGRLDQPALAVVVGTSKPEKNWTAEGYAAVLREAERRHGLRPVLVGGPSAAERAVAERILELTDGRPVDALGDDVRRLVWLLEGSALVLSPDTGPLHIAHALGRPAVGLFGWSNPKRHRPYRGDPDLVVDGYARHPGEDYPVSLERRDGMRRITPERVLRAIDIAVERYVSGPGD